MSYSIIATKRFEKELKRLAGKYHSLKDEFGSLIQRLSEHPGIGDSLGNNCYKIRISIASKGKGKRGGARVITYVYVEAETVYLLTIYDKSEKADLRAKDLKELIEHIEFS